MKGEIGSRIAEWRRLSRDGDFKAINIFLKENPDVNNFVDALTDGIITSIRVKHPNFESELVEKIRKCERLIEMGIPEKVATFFMFKNPDFLDLKVEDVYDTYQYAISRGVTKTAAAVIASTNYFGREEGDSLSLIIDNYFTQRALYGCSTKFLDMDFFKASRYEKLCVFPEARLVFSAIGDFEQEYFDKLDVED